MLLNAFLCPAVPNRNAETVLGAGEKEILLLLQTKEPWQADALKTVPFIAKNCRKFYSKRESGVRTGANMHPAFFGGTLVFKASLRRSRVIMAVDLWVTAENNSTCENGILIRDWNEQGTLLKNIMC